MALVAVNSGSSLSKVMSYVKKNRINIPVIVDSDRSLERSAGVTEVSLKNIWQARMIRPDGSVARANARDLDASMQTAAEGAKWNIDPAGIPNSLKSVWQAVEFGNYAIAAKPLRKMLKARRKEDKAAAEKLNRYVQQQMEKQVAEAQKAAESKPWQAYLKFERIRSSFAGFDLPESVETQRRALAKNESVKNEVAANKQLERAAKASRGNASSRASAIVILRKLIRKYPDTEAAATAQSLLDPPPAVDP